MDEKHGDSRKDGGGRSLRSLGSRGRTPADAAAQCPPSLWRVRRRARVSGKERRRVGRNGRREREREREENGERKEKKVKK